MLTPSLAPEHNKLHQEREDLLAELARLHELIRDEVDMEPDEGDALITEHETAAILIAVLEKRLQEIESAFASIRLGEYNRCERCGHEIPEERLLAKPDARYCIDCQIAVERAIHAASAKCREEPVVVDLFAGVFQ